MSLLIDRFGRKPLMLFGALGCGTCFTLVTVGLAINTKPSLAMSVSFIFGYHLFYVSPICHALSHVTDKKRSRACHFSAFRSCIPLRSTHPACAALATQLLW